MRNPTPCVSLGKRPRSRRCALAGALCATGAFVGFGLALLPPAMGGAGTASGGEANTECAYVITSGGYSPTEPGTTCNQFTKNQVVYTGPCPTTGCPYQSGFAIYDGVCKYPAEPANPPCQTP